MKPGNLVLVKDDAFKGNRKIKDRWENECEGTNRYTCWYIVLCLFLDNSGSPSIVEQ